VHKPPILDNKNPSSASIFQPRALLGQARRQKRLAALNVPRVCILDPDGDIVRRLRDSGAAKRFESWPCYHTQLDTFSLGKQNVGIIGCAVGAPFAVLIAEELFASGCEFLLSLTSAGQIVPAGRLPYFVIIDRALRDEGTSYHYLPGSTFAEAPDASLLARVEQAGRALPDIALHRGTTWTTDAPYRETESAIVRARQLGALAVEMEAAALYAFSATSGRSVVCFAHVTNAMAQTEGDFEKGEADGAKTTLAVIAATAGAWRS